MSSSNSFIEAAKQLLDRFAQKPAKERFDYWVRLGMSDREGRLTKPYGGSAEPEEDSLEAAAHLESALDRLIWVLRRGNDRIWVEIGEAQT